VTGFNVLYPASSSNFLLPRPPAERKQIASGEELFLLRRLMSSWYVCLRYSLYLHQGFTIAGTTIPLWKSREIVHSRKENQRRRIRRMIRGIGSGRWRSRRATDRNQQNSLLIHCYSLFVRLQQNMWFLQAIVGTEVARNYPSLAPGSPENSLLISLFRRNRAQESASPG